MNVFKKLLGLPVPPTGLVAGEELGVLFDVEDLATS